MGDDLIAVVEGANCGAELADYELECGINPEYTTHATLETASFISGVWLFDGNRYVFCPKLGRLLLRLWWTVNPPRKTRVAIYKHSVAVGLMSSYAGMPLYDDFLRPNVLPGAPVLDLPTLRYRPLGQLDLRGFDASEALSRRYGLTRAEIAAFGAYLRNLDQRPAFHVNDAATAIIRRDCPEEPAGLRAFDAHCDMYLFAKGEL